MVFYSFRQAFVVVYYVYDNETFTAFFCENKQKPILKCNGKCQLNKIVEENTSDQKAIANHLDKEIVLYFQSTTPKEFLNLFFQKKVFFSEENKYCYTKFSFLLKPPIV